MTDVCAKGHEMTPENTRLRRGKYAYCRTCDRVASRQRRERLAIAAGRPVLPEPEWVITTRGRRINVARFWSFVPRTDGDGCWLWGGQMRPDGYGAYGGRGGAHRLVYEFLVGPIPQGLEIDHLCNTPRCVNPAHMEPVTRDENMRRRSERQTHCKHGHEFTPENTYRSGSSRACATCHRAVMARYRARVATRPLSGIRAVRWSPPVQLRPDSVTAVGL